jgi:hypothetical protein
MYNHVATARQDQNAKVNRDRPPITQSWGSTPLVSPPGNGIVGHPSGSGEWRCCARPRPSFSRRCYVSIVLQAAGNSNVPSSRIRRNGMVRLKE